MVGIIPLKWIIAAAGSLALLAALYFGYQHWADGLRAEGAAPYIAAIEKQKIEAAAVLAVKQAEVDALNKEREQFIKDRNETDKTQLNALNVLNGKVASLRDAAGRLRDPNAPGCGSSGSGTAGEKDGSSQGGAGDPADAGGLLSAELSGLLQRLQSESDKINVAYASCRPALYEAVK